ncbi:heavy metal translocating P-type ATPase [Methylocystis parvus]|uniref:Cadmium-translocating P-type ATPase n=1 Tax=Methylocystis parvus TaxID=134 RepID=A0A6B8M5H1_9HYPH|nr:heavy metal translocating P-type ATPase [Methylocystis parvus]QGM98181.1 cadmium-translocating P-type ATPase [Methylocystis parvus]WBK01494.1 cadmium-translocating P-type ATPase [Methylocystis parvus OBBP]
MTAAFDFGSLVTHGKDGACRFEAAVDGMTCAACIGEIEQGLADLPGLDHARVNYADRRLALEWRDARFDLAAAFERLRRMGYTLHPFELAESERAEIETSRWLLRCLAIAGFAAMNIMLLSVGVWVGEGGGDIDPATRDLFHGVSALIALPAAAFAGQPFFKSAFAALRAGRLNMDVPISLGVLLALAMSVYETLTHAEHAYFDSATMLLSFLLLGRFLDHAMRRKTRAVAANLAALRAPLACRLSPDGGETLAPLAKIAPGDIVLVRPGERLPVDGVVATGASQLDESLVTGETRRRAVAAGAQVYAGSLNYDGALTIRVEAANGATLLDDIERLLEKATNARSRYVRLADRVSRLYAPMVHLAALVTALFWMWRGASLHDALITAICVLIITCPCALALAVPAVQVVASGALFRAGVLLNSADAIERLAEADTIVFDKTGTLTAPEPRVVNAAEIDAKVMDIAARLARASSHPLARAVAQQRPHAAALEAREDHGLGVAAMVEGVEARLGAARFCGLERQAAEFGAFDAEVSLVAFRHGDATALFKVRQTLRSDAVETIAELKARGFAIEILSGDRVEAVERVAAALRVEQWSGGLKPAEKVARLDALRAEGRKVLMVGDGLNDAPALASAHVSISPIDATQITQAAADAVFLGERLAPVVTTLDLARKSRALMRENLALSVIYNVFAVPLAMAGWLTPLIAAAAMSGSSILVTLNALRAGRAPTAKADPHAAAPPPPSLYGRGEPPELEAAE